jgi:hypothetical protein
MSVPILRNSAGQVVYIALFDGSAYVATPTIVAGDIQISLDGGAFNNMATLPSETPAASAQVQIPLSQAETNAVHIGIRGSDQAGGEWEDFYYSIFTDTDTIGTLANSVLSMDFSTVVGAAARSALNALRFLRNRWAIAGGALTVYEEDDATPAWTGAVSTAVSNPVDEIDPA